MRPFLVVAVSVVMEVIPAQEVVRPVVPSQDWRALRGTDHRASHDGAVPRTWSEKKNIAWRRDLPGPGTSTQSFHREIWTKLSAPISQTKR